MRLGGLCFVLLATGCGVAPTASGDSVNSPTACLHDAACPFLLFAAHRGQCGDDTQPENSLTSTKGP